MNYPVASYEVSINFLNCYRSKLRGIKPTIVGLKEPIMLKLVCNNIQ